MPRVFVILFWFVLIGPFFTEGLIASDEAILRKMNPDTFYVEQTRKALSEVDCFVVHTLVPSDLKLPFTLLLNEKLSSIGEVNQGVPRGILKKLWENKGDDVVCANCLIELSMLQVDGGEDVMMLSLDVEGAGLLSFEMGEGEVVAEEGEEYWVDEIFYPIEERHKTERGLKALERLIDRFIDTMQGEKKPLFILL